jgi:hypothetical protein
MGNTVGLLLLGLGIGMIIAFVVFVDYMASNCPDTKVGCICKVIDNFTQRLPED